MNKYGQRCAIEVDQQEYELGYMPEDALVKRLNNYVRTIGGDNWINSQIHKLNLERKLRAALNPVERGEEEK